MPVLSLCPQQEDHLLMAQTSLGRLLWLLTSWTALSGRTHASLQTLLTIKTPMDVACAVLACVAAMVGGKFAKPEAGATLRSRDTLEQEKSKTHMKAQRALEQPPNTKPSMEQQMCMLVCMHAAASLGLLAACMHATAASSGQPIGMQATSCRC